MPRRAAHADCPPVPTACRRAASGGIHRPDRRGGAQPRLREGCSSAFAQKPPSTLHQLLVVVRRPQFFEYRRIIVLGQQAEEQSTGGDHPGRFDIPPQLEQSTEGRNRPHAVETRTARYDQHTGFPAPVPMLRAEQLPTRSTGVRQARESRLGGRQADKLTPRAQLDGRRAMGKQPVHRDGHRCGWERRRYEDRPRHSEFTGDQDGVEIRHRWDRGRSGHNLGIVRPVSGSARGAHCVPILVLTVCGGCTSTYGGMGHDARASCLHLDPTHRSNP